MCLAATRHHADATDGMNGAAANLSLNSTVLASTASTLATIGLSEAPHLGLLKSGFSRRSKETFTSAELNGCPSCHFTFLRRWNVYVFPSGDTVQRSARSPITLLGSSGSYWSRPL